MDTITFTVTPCEDSGGYVAAWDAPGNSGGIATQGDTLTELQEMIADAVSGWFADKGQMPRVKLHFDEDPELVVS
jgi:predicted RNase H-like HicB family nuclease